MRKISEIITDIEKMYRDYAYGKKELESYKDASKYHFENITKETDESRLIMLGMLLHYRANPTYKWLKEELNELLEDTGAEYLVAQAKKIDKHVAKFLQVIVENDGEIEYEPISSLASEPESYVRPYGGRRPKSVTDAEKTKLENLFLSLKEQNAEDVITDFKIKKLNYTMMDNQYQLLRTELLQAMNEEERSEVGSSVGKFKIVDKDPEYDLTTFIGKTFLKALEYSVRPIDNKIEVIDHFSNESIITEENTFVLDYHTFAFSESGIFVDGEQISTMSKEEILSLEEKLKESEYGYLPIRGFIAVDDTTLLRQLPFSSGKVEKLIDKGFLHPNTLKEYRYVESMDKVRHDFEIIEETSHNARMEVFMDKHMRRAQKLRYMQENAREVLKEM